MKRPSLVAAASAVVLAWAASPVSAQQAQTLRIGASVNGALAANDPTATEDAYRYDDYRFTARGGQRLEAVMRSDAFDAYLSIYAEGEDDPLAEDDDGLGEDTHARLRFTPETDGAYVLRARTFSGIEGGDYVLSLRERPAPPRPPRPSRIVVGGEDSARLTDRDPEREDGGRYRAYAFRGDEGQRIMVSLSSEDFDPVVRIGRMNRSAFEELAQNDDGPDGLNSRLVFTVPAAGDYVIHVTALDEGEGRYTLALAEAPPAPPAKPIAIGDSVDGDLGESSSLNDSGQTAEFYRFTATAGQTVAIEMVSRDFDTYLTLRSAAGDVIAEDDDGKGSGTDSRIATTLEAAGDYVIEARAFDDEGGRFTLSLSEVAPPPPPSAIGFGQTVEGEINEDDPQSDGKHYDAYVFTGAEGQRVQAILRSGDFDAYLEIGAAEGEFSALASDDDGLAQGTDSRLNLTLPSTGDYIVRASPLSGEEKGLYSLELIERGPEPQPGSLLVGATARGTLSQSDAMSEEGAFFDAYRFEAKKDEKLNITLVSNAFDAFIDLGEDGEGFTSLASDDDSLSDTHAKLEWTAPEDGWYVVRARSFGPNETGAYALSVQRQP